MERDFMGQKELCKLSQARIEAIKINANSILSSCQKLDVLFSDPNNFAYIEYLTRFAQDLENARQSILASNGILVRVNSDASQQRKIATAAKKK
ncbi:MAG: hypothetical protein ACP5OA_00040 [Candidatus Woesearchaeota archaeon]